METAIFIWVWIGVALTSLLIHVMMWGVVELVMKLKTEPKQTKLAANYSFLGMNQTTVRL